MNCNQEVAGSIPASGSKNQMEALNMATLGGWNIDEMKGCNLPQKAQSAFTAVTGGINGSDYQPLLYVGIILFSASVLFPTP